jgi:ABC-type bacteriocin/lantibiotic exporter with double-glycine peptidase domain
MTGGGVARAIARFQDDAQLDQRVGEIGVTAPLGGPVGGQRAATASLGGCEAAAGTERDRALVGRDGDLEQTFPCAGVGVAGDGCLRPGIVAWTSKMSPPPPSPTPLSPPRRFLAPEVIQTSAMDCGPAALKCLLEGFGVSVGYGRLREACQTSVDGTSIDTLEALALGLGLEAEQVMMPVDHLLLEESDALPAIVVLRLASGLTHFVVVWRVHGSFVQVMDPARGRRWVRQAAFLREVFVHSLAIAAPAFREWAASEGFTRPLARRLGRLGLERGDREALIARALEDPDWGSLAALDRAVRTVAALVASGALARGTEARRLIDTLASEPTDVGAAGQAPAAGPSIYATATAAPPAEDGEPQVSIRGAVLLRVAGVKQLDAAARAALPIELRAAVDEPRARAGAELGPLLARDGRWRWGALAAGVALTALGAIAEALLFRTLIDLASGRGGGAVARVLAKLSGRPVIGQGALFVTIGLVLVALLALELPLAGGLRGAGRRLEERLRRLILRKIPRLPDRYFQSRPVSDLAERAHALHRLRVLPTLGADLARTALEIAVIAAGLCWLDPRDAPLVIGMAAAMLLIPFLAEPAVAERDLRMRNHAGALGRFYLDGLLGLTAVRTHGAEPALAREHRDRLREWLRAARGALVAALTAEAVQSLVGFGLAVWLLLDFFGRRATGAGTVTDAGTALLVVYWALSLPALGQELALLAQQIPAQRNLTLRLIEPLGAPEEGAPEGAARESSAGAQPDDPAPLPSSPVSPAASGPAAIRLHDVRVVAGGRQILEIDTLSIAAGEQLAIVGASGAGKSSLVGLLLGWYRPASGAVEVDGQPLDGAALAALRRRTVWVDPSVYLWNRSLAENLAFGSAETAEAAKGFDGLAAVVEDADLDAVVRGLPAGLDTPLGEAGGLVSGGEGQRVRFGRGLLRQAPRLVILDEPFRGLSRGQRAQLLSRARARWSSATLICVTHDIQETESFPRVLVVADGRIAEDGGPSELLARADSRYRALADAERRVMAASWSAAVWRRVRLEGGRVAGTSP